MSGCLGTLPVTTSWAGALTPPDIDGFNRVVFVALADNVDTDGSLQLPFHTVAEGLAEAAARTPTATSPVLVYVFGGVFSESGLSPAANVHLRGSGVDTTIVRNASEILSVTTGDTSISEITFEATGTNRIASVDGTSMTDYARFYDCKFVGNGSNGNAVYFKTGAPTKLFSCNVEGENVGDRMLETDSNASNDVQFFHSTVLGDVLHAGGDLEFSDVTANMGVSCTGSSSLAISDSFVRNSIDHCLELGTTGDVSLYQSTFISPGYVNPDNFYCVNITVDPGTVEWIANTFRHDGSAPDYTVYSSVTFTFAGDRNDFEEGYNGNCTDNGLSTKATPVDADLVIIEDSADNYKRKKVELGDIGIGGGGASALSDLTIDTDKDWQGYSITNLDEVEVGGALTIPSDVVAVNTGDIRYNTTAVALEYYDGASWHDAGSPAMLASVDTAVAEGNNSLTGLGNKFIAKTLIIETSSTDWTLTIYSKDDYTSDELILLKNRNGDVIYNLDLPYEDKDATAEFHYNFTDASGSNTHDVELWGTSLR